MKTEYLIGIALLIGIYFFVIKGKKGKQVGEKKDVEIEDGKDETRPPTEKDKARLKIIKAALQDAKKKDKKDLSVKNKFDGFCTPQNRIKLLKEC